MGGPIRTRWLHPKDDFRDKVMGWEGQQISSCETNPPKLPENYKKNKLHIRNMSKYTEPK